MSDRLTLEELSERTGEPPVSLRRWRELGLIGREEDERFRGEDVERARLVTEFVRLGKRRLKGLTEAVELFEARPATAEGRQKLVDPVCGMEMGETEVAARLTRGHDRAFCSDECLRRFVAAPERYA